MWDPKSHPCGTPTLTMWDPKSDPYGTPTLTMWDPKSHPCGTPTPTHVGPQIPPPPGVLVVEAQGDLIDSMGVGHHQVEAVLWGGTAEVAQWVTTPWGAITALWWWQRQRDSPITSMVTGTQRGPHSQHSALPAPHMVAVTP